MSRPSRLTGRLGRVGVAVAPGDDLVGEADGALGVAVGIDVTDIAGVVVDVMDIAGVGVQVRDAPGVVFDLPLVHAAPNMAINATTRTTGAARRYVAGMADLRVQVQPRPAARPLTRVLRPKFGLGCGAFAFESRRSRMQKAWAGTVRVTWRCQPVKFRPSKWSMPRPVFKSR
jgi:hypothetical protein